jgi:hypothetical protein
MGDQLVRNRPRAGKDHDGSAAARGYGGPMPCQKPRARRGQGERYKRPSRTRYG